MMSQKVKKTINSGVVMRSTKFGLSVARPDATDSKAMRLFSDSRKDQIKLLNLLGLEMWEVAILTDVSVRDISNVIEKHKTKRGRGKKTNNALA